MSERFLERVALILRYESAHLLHLIQGDWMCVHVCARAHALSTTCPCVSLTMIKNLSRGR